MKLRTLLALALSGRARVLSSAIGVASRFHRACFLAAAAHAGLLRALADGPRTLAQICDALGVPPNGRPALEAWLRVGVRTGVLAHGPDGWSPQGLLARALAQVANDDVAALLEETATLHRRLIMETPRRLRENDLFALSDHDGRTVARSSRVLEPFVFEAMDEVVPGRGPARLLDIGCGSGSAIRHAARRNPQLTALGIELQADVAALARANVREWGLADRAGVEADDIRHRRPEAVYDVALLNNNIYYFPAAARVKVLSHVRAFLKPRGRVLVTTACTGGSSGMQLLDLWGLVTRGMGGLPDPEEMGEQLQLAGFELLRAWNLLRGVDQFWAFAGRKAGD